ncbi:MAG: DUF5723 family protein [Bacteroidota bacterium]
MSRMHRLFEGWLFQLFILSLISAPLRALSQYDAQLPFLKETGVPVFDRPSLIPSNKFFIGLPGLTCVNTRFINDGLSYLDAHTLTDTGAYIDIPRLIGKLRNHNTLSFGSSIDLFGAGIGVGKYYISMNVSHRAGMTFRYPKELLEFLYKGNGAFIGSTVDLSKTGFDATRYWEIGLGINQKITEKWAAGFRVRKLFGTDNASTSMQTLRANTATNDYELQLSSDLVVNTCTPLNTPGGLDSVSNSPGGMTGYVFGTGNGGWAFNLGAAFTPDDRLTVALDVLDIGSITWKTTPVNYRLDNGYYSFSGLAVEDVLNSNADTIDVVKAYVDSLKNAFDVQQTNDEYTTALPVQLLLSGEYIFNPRFSGVMAIRSVFFKNEFIPHLTAMGRYKAGKHFTFGGSLCLQSGNFVTFGASVVGQFGLFNVFMVSDDVYGTIMPLHTSSSHFAIGLSILRPLQQKEIRKATRVKERY